MHQKELLLQLDSLLNPSDFSDYCHNGLQVEGQNEINKIICGVSANEGLIQQAVDKDADAIFVHHGFLWKPGLMRVGGYIRKRMALLLKHEINLFAYHLPLDAHSLFGNNVGLVQALGVQNSQPFAEYNGKTIGFAGNFKDPLSLKDVEALVAQKIGQANFVFGEGKDKIRTIAICSGGAPDCIEEAAAKGFDLYLTGESAERTQSIARELGINFIAAGHHATECFGARSIAGWMKDELGLDAQFVDIPNPV